MGDRRKDLLLSRGQNGDVRVRGAKMYSARTRGFAVGVVIAEVVVISPAAGEKTDDLFAGRVESRGPRQMLLERVAALFDEPPERSQSQSLRIAEDEKAVRFFGRVFAAETLVADQIEPLAGEIR